ncbi:MAG TPA: VOC family protein [Candidatus Cybelea sp.]|jgi:PhnB protein|nr:VOC family protein [Candidatus Cybelea sp.]
MSADKNIKVETYLFFDGRCAEAVEFYRHALGAEVLMMLRYKECPDKGMIRPGTEDKIMHASIQVGDTRIMASDDCSGHTPKPDGFSMSIAAPDEATAKKFFTALGEGGQVKMPLAKTFFSPCFGMLTDRFGVGWMVITQQA